MKIQLVMDDITRSNADAIVNAANEGLYPGGGVCGAIFKAAGYDKLNQECRSIGHCDTGNAVITNGYDLKAKYIIHTVGPRYTGSKEDPILLYNAYYNSLALASSYNLESIAFPSISTGIFSYPLKEASSIAIKAIHNYFDKNKESSIKIVYFYFLDTYTYHIYESQLQTKLVV